MVADAADVGRAAGDAPAHLDDRAASCRSACRRRRSRCGSCRRSPTGRSGRGCCACPAWPTSRSGASACRSSTSTSTRRGCAAHDVTLDDVMNATADVARRRAAALRRLRERDRHRRLRRHAQPAARRSATCCRSQTPRDLAQDRRSSASDGEPRAARRRRAGQGGHTSRSSATRSSTAGPACCWSSRSPPGANTLEVTHGVDKALQRAAARACPASRSTPTIFRPGGLHRDRGRQPHAGAAARLPAGDR